MWFSLVSLVVLVGIPSAYGRLPTYHRSADSILGMIFYIDALQSPAFGLFAQLADKTLVPDLNKKSKQDLTIMMPNTDMFEAFIVANGGNMSDPETLTTAEWKDKWNDVFEYFWFDGLLNTTAVAPGETVVMNSYKKSPVGDWPLTMTFRREEAYTEEDPAVPYNGTVDSAPFGNGNISIPDYPVMPWIVASVLSYWPVEPKNLSITVDALNVSGWDQVKSRVPFAAALETERNFTLFLPPTEALATALALSDTDLALFLDYHLVPERVVLSQTEQAFTTVAGTTLTASTSAVNVGSHNATVVTRDVFSNGIVVQTVDQALVTVAGNGLVARSLSREREEL